MPARLKVGMTTLTWSLIMTSGSAQHGDLVSRDEGLTASLRRRMAGRLAARDLLQVTLDTSYQ